MPIFLRDPVALDLIEATYGDIEGLVAEWEHRNSIRSSFPSPRQRSTIYRWLDKGLPSGGGNILAFCALLDADPLSLFDYDRNGYFSKFAWLRRSLQLGLSSAGVFRPLYEMYRPGPHWPENRLARKFFRRDWFIREFDNGENWRCSDDVLVTAQFKENIRSRPRAVHIAYRRRKTSDTMWRFYGTVIRLGDRVELYSEGGAFQHMDHTEAKSILFRTHFGGREVEWRVASLHDFNLKLEFPFNDRTVVGFEW